MVDWTHSVQLNLIQLAVEIQDHPRCVCKGVYGGGEDNLFGELDILSNTL